MMREKRLHVFSIPGSVIQICPYEVILASPSDSTRPVFNPSNVLETAGWKIMGSFKKNSKAGDGFGWKAKLFRSHKVFFMSSLLGH